MDTKDNMLADAAKRRLEAKPLLTITIAAGGAPGPAKGKPKHKEGCECEECMGEEGEGYEEE